MRERASQTHLSRHFFLSFSPSHTLFLAFSLSLFLLLSSCSVPLYKVAPIPQNSAIVDGKTGTTQGLEITAAALFDDDKSFERFASNLPLAGIIAVDVYLKNNSAATLKPKFSLRDSAHQNLSLLDAKNVLKQMMKFEGVRAYVKEGKQLTLDQLSAMALPKKIEIGPQSEKRGVLFFRAKVDAMKLDGLRLEVGGLAAPIIIPIN